MDIITIFMVGVVFCLALVFSLTSINLHKGEWAFLAMVCWFSFAGLNLIYSSASLYAFSYLFAAIGVIFLAVGLVYSFEAMLLKKKDREYREEWELD